MADRGYTFFDTALGVCAISWSPQGVTWIQLPEASVKRTAEAMRRRFPDLEETVPPRRVRKATDRMAAHLKGTTNSLASVVLDMTGVPPFHQRVYEALRTVRAGTVVTYGELAQRIGSPGAARAVGQAMARNPFPIVVPCHRVLACGGRIGGFSAFGEVDTKLRMLAIEGVSLPGPTLGLSYDPEEAVETLTAADPALGRAIRRTGPFLLCVSEMKSPFEALATAIVYQQLTGKAAATIVGRFVSSVGGSRFPAPEQVVDVPLETLRAVGLSRNKAAAIQDLASKTLDGTVPTLRRLRGMGDEEIVDSLTKVRGVGRWTVEMMLIFRLGRPDVLPVDDYGVRKGFASVMARDTLPSPRDMGEYGELWRPFRSVASWYLWRAAENADSTRRRGK